MDDSFFESKFFYDVLGDVVADMVRAFLESDASDIKISKKAEQKILEMIDTLKVKK